MIFEWDNSKNAANTAKHGLSFEVAVRIFEGDVVTWAVSRVGQSEQREVSIGRLSESAAIVVVHTARGQATRIVSARPASRKERARYEQALRAADDRGRAGEGEG